MAFTYCIRVLSGKVQRVKQCFADFVDRIGSNGVRVTEKPPLLLTATTKLLEWSRQEHDSIRLPTALLEGVNSKRVLPLTALEGSTRCVCRAMYLRLLSMVAEILFIWSFIAK